MSAALEISVLSTGLEGLQARVRMVAAGMADTRPLLEALGAELVSQSHRRIADEKQAPDGSAWPAWSEDYARTRHAGQSLLRADGGLLDSLLWAVSPDRVEAGSNLVYAAAQQFGLPERSVPGRAYLGVSDADAEALLEIAMRFADAHLRRHFG